MTSKSFEEIYAAVVSETAICQLPPRAFIVATGDDRGRFVNAMVTCDIRDLEPGQSTYGFFTDSKGRVLADVFASATGEGLLLDLPADRTATISEHMLRYKVADRVDITPSGDFAELVLAGPGSPRRLESLLGLSGLERQNVHWPLAQRMSLQPEPRLGVPAFRFMGPDAVVRSMKDRLVDEGTVVATEDVVASVRIERGVPWFGRDFGEDNFPQETGLDEAAVSYTKGCYLGQEIVARIHYRGQVNRRIQGLRGGASAIAVGTGVFSDDDCVGEVTSAAWSPILGAHVALAIVHRKAEDTVTLSTGETLTRVELPLVDGQPG